MCGYHIGKISSFEFLSTTSVCTLYFDTSVKTIVFEARSNVICGRVWIFGMRDLSVRFGIELTMNRMWDQARATSFGEGIWIKRIDLCCNSCRCNEEEQYLIAISETSNSTSTSDVQELDRDLYLGIYAVFVICLLFFTLLRTQLFFKLTIVASRMLHLRMFSALLRAPSYFFDTNSIGEGSFRYVMVLILLIRSAQDQVCCTTGD